MCAASTVFATKKNGYLRFCVDYRCPNAVMNRDLYPIPRMDKCIASLDEAAVFSTLDVNSRYGQVQRDKAERDKTAFTSHHGLLQFIRMPLGIRNAPGTIQQVVYAILSPVRRQYTLMYLYDTDIFSGTPQEHIRHVRKALPLPRDAGVAFKLKNCRLSTTTIDYLSHVVRPKHLKVSSHTTDAIRGLKALTNFTELRYFLGLCNVFRQIILNFVRLVAPLDQ